MQAIKPYASRRNKLLAACFACFTVGFMLHGTDAATMLRDINNSLFDLKKKVSTNYSRNR